MRRLPTRARPDRLLVTGLAVLALGLSGCGGSEPAQESADPGSASAGGDEGATEDPEDDREPVEVVQASVDATLGNERMTVDSQATLQVAEQGFSLFSEGAVDYGAAVSDLRFGVTQAGESTEVTVLADGTDAWVSVDGEQAPALPGGATWVQGDAADLPAAGTFQPEGLLGVVLALRAAEDVDEFDTEDHDGVTTRVFGTTIAYADAVAAAGEDAQAFTTALSLTGEAEQADLDIQVAIGPDDVIRTYDLSVESDAAVSGGYDIDLSGVGRDVAVPSAPDPDEVATGPDAEEVFRQLLDA